MIKEEWGFSTFNNVEMKEFEEFYQLSIVKEENEEFNEKYRIGMGGYSNVYLFKGYAVKVYTDKYYPLGLKIDKEPLRDTDGEFLLQLNGISIFPKVYAHVNDKFTVMEYIKGKSAYHGCNFNLNYMKDLYLGFSESFQRGLLPSDLHIQNILVDENGNPKVIDVGNFKKEWDKDDLRHFGHELSELRHRIPRYLWYDNEPDWDEE